MHTNLQKHLLTLAFLVVPAAAGAQVGHSSGPSNPVTITLEPGHYTTRAATMHVSKLPSKVSAATRMARPIAEARSRRSGDAVSKPGESVGPVSVELDVAESAALTVIQAMLSRVQNQALQGPVIAELCSSVSDQATGQPTPQTCLTLRDAVTMQLSRDTVVAGSSPIKVDRITFAAQSGTWSQQ